MDLDEQAQIFIDRMWTLLGDKRVSGRSPYEVAMMIGAADQLARVVQAKWTGPDPFP